MSTKPAAVKNKLRIIIYVSWALISFAIFMGGLSPLLLRHVDTIELIAFYGVLIGGVPLFLIRTRFFDRLVTSGGGRKHPLAAWHGTVIRLMTVTMAVALALMVWRATTVGLPGWKTAFLMAFGLFLFYVAGWLLHAPRFMLRESR